MSRRFQFSLKRLFVAMLVVAAFFGGMSVQRQLDKRKAPVVVRIRQDAKWKDVFDDLTARSGTEAVKVEVTP
jgi:hypothetical protein